MVAPQGEARHPASRRSDQAVVAANNVPDPQAGTGYHLFLFRDGEPEAQTILKRARRPTVVGGELN